MKIHFMSQIINIESEKEVSLYDVLSKCRGIKLHAPCGGRGRCKKCMVLAVFSESADGINSIDLSESELIELQNSAHLPDEYKNLAKPVLACLVKDSSLVTEVFLPDYNEMIGAGASDAKRECIVSKAVDLSDAVSFVLKINLTLPTTASPINTEENLKAAILNELASHNYAIPKKLHIRIPDKILSDTSLLLSNYKNELFITLSEEFPRNSTATPDDSNEIYFSAVKISEVMLPPIGLAVDIGTTTVCTALINLSNNELIMDKVFENPQRKFGADVISRMSYALENGKTGIEILKSAIHDAIRKNVSLILDDINAKHLFSEDLSISDITYATISGNSVMEHMFIGLDTSPISKAPFFLQTKFGFTYHASELLSGENSLLLNANAPVYISPLPASYVGGDISMGLAYLMTTRPEVLKENSLFLDLGTNGEICVIANNDNLYNSDKKLLLAATAAGPALEGAHIKHGLPALPGAIYSVEVDDENKLFAVKTVNDLKPIGICGSGIISAISSFLSTGLVTEFGRICDDGEPEDDIYEDIYPYFEKYLSESDEGKPVINLTISAENSSDDDICITDSDVRQVQTAKAAIAAGTSVLLSRAGLDAKNLDAIYLAGSFGGGINTVSATHIGLLPRINGKILSVGNTSVKGSSLFMIDKSFRSKLNSIMNSSEYIELSSDPEFTNCFVDSMMFSDEI